MKQHAITLAHGTYTELKDTEGAKERKTSCSGWTFREPARS